MDRTVSDPTLYYRLSGRREREQDVFFEQALDSAMWQPATDNDAWDTCWHTGMPDRSVFRATSPKHTVNHVPGNSCLTIKTRLYRTIRALRERVAASHPCDDSLTRRADFVPASYDMPSEYHALQAAATEAPDKLWMLKPENGARGRDIRLLDDVAEAPTDSRWMVQEYLAQPHLMNDRKYVLRLYVLISSIEPLRVYLYRQGFAKLASCAYSVDDRDNPYVHQTNPDVNARNDQAESPVVFVDLERYRMWLREQGHDDERLFERIRDLVTLTIIGAREPMRAASERSGADPRGCYELMGLDCLIDSELNPWLLECNLSPSLEVCAARDDGGALEEEIKQNMVSDMVALIGLNDPGRVRVGASGTFAETAAEADTELACAGDFERVFPALEPERYWPYFPYPRQADFRLAQHVTGQTLEAPKVRSWQVAEVIASDQLSLYAERQGRLLATNSTAALIWLHATNDAAPAQIARNLRAAIDDTTVDSDADDADLERIVWDSLADWACNKLLVQGASTQAAPSRTPPTASTTTQSTPGVSADWILSCGASEIRLRIWSASVAQRLLHPFRPLQRATEHSHGDAIDIVRGHSGYSVLHAGALIAEGLTMAQLGPWLSDELLRRAPDAGEVVLPGAVVEKPSMSGGARRAVLICRDLPDSDDRLALSVHHSDGLLISGGARIDISETGRASAIGLPLRRALTPADIVQHQPLWHYGESGTLHEGAPPGEVSDLCIDAVIIAAAGEAAAGDEPTRLDLHQALGYLLPQALALGGHTIDRQACQLLASWLSERPVFRIDPDHDAATRTVISIITDG